MRLFLEVIKGTHLGKHVEVGPNEVVSIGRTNKATITMGDSFMSGSHFAVECSSKGYQLRDLQSRNGTKLNDELIIEALLKNGDRVFAGSTEFIVRIAEEPNPQIGSEQAKDKMSPAVVERKSGSRKKKSAPLKVASDSRTEVSNLEAPPKKTRRPLSELDLKRLQAGSKEPIDQSRVTSVTPNSDRALLSPEVSAVGLISYEAVTPQGRLRRIISSQPQGVMALVDAAHDVSILELLRASSEKWESLYRPEQKATITPFLVQLPQGSTLLKQMIRRGWGRQWGVYLTCSLSLSELREYFRQALMVTMSDGMELFSRFYDPRFFRGFLSGCTADEAEKFFGPIVSYFMEDERPEILLQFTRGKRGVEKKGHLLSDLS